VQRSLHPDVPPEYEAVAVLAAEVRSFVQQAVGAIAFAEAHEAHRATVDDARAAKKARRSIQEVADPQAAAQRRLKLSAKKNAAKKAKLNALLHAKGGFM